MRVFWLTALYWLEDVFTKHYWAVALVAVALIALLAWAGVIGVPGHVGDEGCVRYSSRVEDC